MSTQLAQQTRPYVISRRAYEDAEDSGAHVCFHCGTITTPLPLSAHEPSGVEERTCSACGNACALPVAAAVAERWLEVEP